MQARQEGAQRRGLLGNEQAAQLVGALHGVLTDGKQFPAGSKIGIGSHARYFDACEAKACPDLAVRFCRGILSGMGFLANARFFPVCNVMRTHGFREVQLLEFRVLSGQVVLRIVADEDTGVGNVEALEAIVAQAVQDGKLYILHINAAVDELIEVSVGDEGVEHADTARVLRGLDGLERADAERDHTQPFFLRHVAAQRLPEAL